MSGGQLRQADDKYDRTNDQQTRTVTDSRLTANEQNLQRKTTRRGGLSVGQGENTFVNGANNNVSLDTETFIRIKGPTSGFSLTGILHGEKGALYILLNTTTQAMTIAHESTSSSANNRILCPDAVDLVMEATSNQGVMVCYDTTAKRWRVLGRKVITSDIADNSVTYAKMQDITETSRVIGRKTAGAGDPEELTPTDLLTFLKTVDGSGSGLDADLLDGQDSSYYTNILARLGYTPVNKAGDTMTGNLIVQGDILAYRAGGGTGVIFFNSAANRYLYWDGSNYIFGAAGTAIHTGNLGAQFTTSWTSPGYVRLPNGVIIQWGVDTSGASAARTITFPTAFPNGCFGVGAVGAAASGSARVVTYDSISQWNFVARVKSLADAISGASFAWMAIGF